MNSCLFCRIVAGEIPAHRVYEDDKILAFLDIGPLVPGHLLVIPKGHFATMMELPPAWGAAIGERLPGLMRALLAATGATGCHLLVNNGRAAQQSVDHLHYHLLPRGGAEHFSIPWPAGKLDNPAGLVAALQRQLGQAAGAGELQKND